MNKETACQIWKMQLCRVGRDFFVDDAQMGKRRFAFGRCEKMD